MLSRRGFLTGAIAALPVVAVSAELAELLAPKRTIFLPPRSGWFVDEEFVSFRKLRDAILDVIKHGGKAPACIYAAPDLYANTISYLAKVQGYSCSQIESIDAQHFLLMGVPVRTDMDMAKGSAMLLTSQAWFWNPKQRQLALR